MLHATFRCTPGRQIPSLLQRSSASTIKLDLLILRDAAMTSSSVSWRGDRRKLIGLSSLLFFDRGELTTCFLVVTALLTVGGFGVLLRAIWLRHKLFILDYSRSEMKTFLSLQTDGIKVACNQASLLPAGSEHLGNLVAKPFGNLLDITKAGRVTAEGNRLRTYP